MSAFEALGVNPEIIHATEEMGWNLPTDVQDEAIPLILGGGDVMIAAETGSGKTGAFAIPTLQIAYETLRGELDISAVPEGKDGPVVLSMSDKDVITAVSQDGLSCQVRHPSAWAGVRCSVGVLRGKWYFEGFICDEGLCRLGWSAKDGPLVLGTDKTNKSFGFGGTGMKAFGGAFVEYGDKFGMGDVIGCYVDRDLGKIGYCKNGKDLGVAFDIPKQLQATALFPTVTLKNAEMKLNFGQTPFKFSPPHGFAAFASMKPDQRYVAQAESDKKVPQNATLALIIEPTKELAKQVYDEISQFKVYLHDPVITHQCFVGGGNQKDIEAAIRHGVNIIVATPGRIIDAIRSGKLDLSHVRSFILDEADAFDQSSQKEILYIWDKLPKGRSLQVVVCSATLHSPEIRELADKICFNPTWVDLKGRDSVPETVDHAIITVDPTKDDIWQTLWRTPHDNLHACPPDGKFKDFKDPMTLSLATKLMKPYILVQLIDTFQMEQCMIFCRTQLDCDNLEKFLLDKGRSQGASSRGGDKGRQNPYSCVVLHGGRSQPEREKNFQMFKDGEVRFLISSDVGARGLDIKELPFVINMCLPDKAEQYIHRVGRVGRAGASGLAISLVSTVKERVWYHSSCHPSSRRSCQDTRLVEEKGCTIWYDEPEMLRQVEKRLSGIMIPHLDRLNLLKGREHILASAVAGRRAEQEAIEAVKQKVAATLPAWQQLVNLEVEAQQNFLALQFQQQLKHILSSKAN